MADNPDYYQVLRVSPQATPEAIKQAFRALARQYHPDLNPDPEAQEQFKQICAAYNVLSDADRRREYDRDRDGEGEVTLGERNARDAYLRGIECALQQDYAGALAAYREAIAREPRFLPAYIKAAEAQFKLGDDREVLEICRQALDLEPTCAEAHFYQGRSRYRLGYPQSALESYHQALHSAPEAADFYYHRGLAHHDLGDRSRAAADWHQAAQLFQAQGDRSGERLARETLRRSRRGVGWSPSLGAWVGQGLGGLLHLAVNPSGSGWMAPAQGPPLAAAVLGLGYGAIANLAWLGGVYWGWRDLLPFNPVSLLLVGGVPWATLAASSAIARLLWPRPVTWASDFLISGAALLPLGSLALISIFSQALGPTSAINASVWVAAWTILILYSGAIDLLKLPPAAATWWTLLSLTISGWLTWIVFLTLF